MGSLDPSLSVFYMYEYSLRPKDHPPLLLELWLNYPVGTVVVMMDERCSRAIRNILAGANIIRQFLVLTEPIERLSNSSSGLGVRSVSHVPVVDQKSNLSRFAPHSSSSESSPSTSSTAE